MLLVPRDSVVDFLMQYAEPPIDRAGQRSRRKWDVQVVVEYFTARVLQPMHSERLLPVFRELCARVWELDKAKGLGVFPDSVVLEILRALSFAQDWVFFAEAVSHLGTCPSFSFFGPAMKNVESAQRRAGDAISLVARNIEKGYVFLDIRHASDLQLTAPKPAGSRPGILQHLPQVPCSARPTRPSNPRKWGRSSPAAGNYRHFIRFQRRCIYIKQHS